MRSSLAGMSEPAYAPPRSGLIRGACPHDCPDTCAWEVTVEDGRAVKLGGVKEHPFTRGGLCAKVSHYLERAASPERLLTPLRRSGPKGSGAFTQIGWDEALDVVAARLHQVVAEHGGEAVLPYSFMGTQGLVQGASMAERFFHRLGAIELERDICGQAAAVGAAATIGGGPAMVPQDLVHSRLIVLWGTNTVVTNLHLWPLVQEARKAGARVVVIDPLRTRTAQAADQHIAPMPGTDAALALGLMHVIVRDALHDADYLERYTLGFDALRERLAAYPPERVAAITGLDRAVIEELACAYATTRPAAIRVLIGMEHHEHGAAAFRAIACLPALMGAWRERGGGLLRTTGFAAWAPLNQQAVTRPDLRAAPTRSVNMVRIGEALTRAEPPVRALVVWSSNPAAIAPDQRAVLDGLRREDLFTVVAEQFLTDTALHADVVLPVTMQTEHVDLVPSWGHTFITLNRPAVQPPGECRTTTDVFRGLAKRTGFTESCFADSDEAIVRQALDSDHPYLEGVDEARLLRDGYAEVRLPDEPPYAQGGFRTPSGRCELYSQSLADAGLDPLPGWEPAGESPAGDPQLAARYPLALLSPKSAHHFLNSSYSHLPRHLGPQGEAHLELHPDDARARGIADGGRVAVFNDRARLEVPVRVSERVRPGVVCLPSGYWASRSPGGLSVNALTSDALTDRGGGAALHSTLVQVERAAD